MPSVALALSDYVFEASIDRYQTLRGRRISRDGCPDIGEESERVAPSPSPIPERTGEYALYRLDRVPWLGDSEVDLLSSYSSNTALVVSILAETAAAMFGVGARVLVGVAVGGGAAEGVGFKVYGSRWRCPG